jgi:hypothetical protein
MASVARELLQAALIAKQRHLDSILRLPNVIACGVGYKNAGRATADEVAVIVSVTRKLPAAVLAATELIPRLVDGIRTDVVETGVLRACQGPRERWRPVIPPGVSVGHIEATAGTLGCLVHRAGEAFILSNNHVLANTNRCQVGDPILQPGRLDGGAPADRIATLADYVPLDFGGEAPTCRVASAIEQGLNALAGAIGSQHRLMTYQRTEGINRVDAALARPDDPAMLTPEIVGIGRPRGVRRATLGTPVKKSGRTTGCTEGRIIQIDVTSTVAYGPAQARFYGQLMATGMSQPGDSGAAVLDAENFVVGLLFAGSENSTLVTPIHAVLEALRVDVVT